MRLKTFFAILICLVAVIIIPARAETQPGHSIGIFGDSLGDGLWSGLYSTEKQHPNDKLFRHAKVGAGLTRPDFYAWIHEFAQQIDTDKTDVAIVMFGANDEQGIRDENHKGYIFKSDGWKRTYTSRMDAMFAEFEKRKITVVWMGLPIMRSAEMNEGAAYLNDLFATEVKAHSGTFVSLIDDFKGPDGNFSTHYTDTNGKQHLLRADDGVHFTGYGYELIANKAYAALPSTQTPVSPIPVSTAPTPAAVAPMGSTAPASAPRP